MATITIDGTDYEFEADFDIGEARIVKRYTNLNLAELDGHDPTNPDFIASVIHIVFRREDPDVKFEEIEARVNAVKLASLDMRDDDEVQLSPPEQSKPSEKPDSDGETGEPSNGLPAPSPEIESPETTGHLP